MTGGADGNARNCYCRPGDASCGTCERCGAPGHTRHFPGPVPSTGSWCDRCYRIVGIRSAVLRWVPAAVIVGLGVLGARACSG